jgi:hypothetical protein
MEDHLDALHGLLNGVEIGDIALDDIDAARDLVEIRGIARAEVIQHANAIAALQERIDEMRANETCAARD